MPGVASSLARASLIASDRQVDGGEGTERAVVHDVGIGDRQDHARASGASQASIASCR